MITTDTCQEGGFYGEHEPGCTPSGTAGSWFRISAAYLDVCKLRAEYRGISIEQFFKQEPECYKQYCRIVLEE